MPRPQNVNADGAEQKRWEKTSPPSQTAEQLQAQLSGEGLSRISAHSKTSLVSLVGNSDGAIFLEV